MTPPPTDELDPLAQVVRVLLRLIIEAETLRSLVWSMVAGIPKDAMSDDEVAMLDDVLAERRR